MDLNRVEILLERYWNCVSTVEEENELKLLFNSNDVPDELKESADLFKYFEQQKQATLNEKFNEEIIEKIKLQQSPTVIKINRGFRNYMRVAAAVLVILAASFIFRMEFWQGEKPKLLLVEDTFQTPEEAYAETKKAFMLIAEKMNSGRKQAQKVFNKAISPSFRELRYDPFDIKPVLNPIDFVVFKDMTKKKVVNDIVFLSKETELLFLDPVCNILLVIITNKT